MSEVVQIKPGKKKINKRAVAITVASIIAIIGLVLIIGITKFNWFSKFSVPASPGVFVETPYVYKVDLADIAVPLLNGGTAPWIASPTYDQVLSKVRSIWDPGLYNDPNQ